MKVEWGMGLRIGLGMGLGLAMVSLSRGGAGRGCGRAVQVCWNINQSISCHVRGGGAMVQRAKGCLRERGKFGKEGARALMGTD